MNKTWILGMATIVSFQATGSYATVNHRMPAQAAQQSADAEVALHQSQILASKIILQLDYLRATQQIEMQNLVMGRSRDNGFAATSVGVGGKVSGPGLITGALVFAYSHTFSYKAPGVYEATRSNPSSIIGDPSGGTYKYTITWKQAYGPFILAGAASAAGAASLALGASFDSQPAATELGRKLIGFDSKLNNMILSSISDLSEVLSLTSEQERALTDAVTENAVRQIAKNDGTLNIDILAIAKASGLLNPAAEQSMKDILFISMENNYLEKLAEEQMNDKSIQVADRVAGLRILQQLLIGVQGKNPAATQKLKAMNTRVTLALSYLENIK